MELSTDKMPNGLRYWLVGGVDSIWGEKNIGARKRFENGTNPTSPVHALLGGMTEAAPKPGTRKNLESGGLKTAGKPKPRKHLPIL